MEWNGILNQVSRTVVVYRMHRLRIVQITHATLDIWDRKKE